MRLKSIALAAPNSMELFNIGPSKSIPINEVPFNFFGKSKKFVTNCLKSSTLF